jgi:hypothetical protein
LVNELHQIYEIADHHHKNNHLPWDYCTWLHDQCQFHPEFATFTHTAWHLSSQYLCSHPSDASHINYRQQIIKRIIHDCDRLKDSFLTKDSAVKEAAMKEGFTTLSDNDAYLIGIIMHEFVSTCSLLGFWTNFEGVWSYIRFLTWCWLKELPNLVSRRGKIQVQEIALCSDNNCPFRTCFFSHIQPKFLKLVEDDSSYVRRYKNWMDMFL